MDNLVPPLAALLTFFVLTSFFLWMSLRRFRRSMKDVGDRAWEEYRKRIEESKIRIADDFRKRLRQIGDEERGRHKRE